jgi:hypothetical protein
MLEASQIGVLGLDDVKQAAGPLWSSIGERIREGSLERVKRLLAPGDVVLPAGDGYLVIYASQPGRDLAEENKRIQQELNAFYLGEEATKSVRAEARLQKLDAAQLAHLAKPAPVSAPSARPAATLAPEPAAQISAPFVCLPGWSMLNQALVIYWMMPTSGTPDRPFVGYSEDWCEDPGRCDQDYFDLDCAMLRAAQAGAEACLQRGQRCLVGTSVHASTLLTTKRRAHYLTEAHKTPPAIRPYLIARVSEIPPGTPLTRIGEWVNQIKPIASRVVLQVHESDRGLATMDETGALGVSVTLAQKQASQAGRRYYERQIAHWTAMLQHRRILLQLNNVNEPQLLKAALTHGVDALTSFTLWPPVTNPEGVRLYSRAQVMQDIARAETPQNILHLD